MASSKDITAYNAEELEIVMLALEKNITLTFASKSEATYVRSRIYAVRTAAIHSWEKKQKLEKAGLDTAHLNIPIVDAAQEIMSITVLRENDTTIVVGRRLLRPSISNVLKAAISNAGGKTAEAQQAAAMKAMEDRLRQVKPEETDTTLADLGYASPQTKMDSGGEKT